MAAIPEEVYWGLLFTTIAGLSTTVGAAIAFFIKKPSERILAVALGFSAGVMIAVSFVELYPAAIDDVGFLEATIVFFAGIFTMQLLDLIIPHDYAAEHRHHGFTPLTSAVQAESAIDDLESSKRADDKVMRVGMLTAFGIALHNFPEGLVTLASTVGGGIELGFVIMIAIALHNIPEGLSVSVPIYHATGDKKKAFKLSFLSGVAEPIGALVGVLFLLPFLDTDLIGYSLAFVAGIMVIISLDELLPTANSYPDQEEVTAIGIIVGMMLMIGTLIALNP
ncbi:MAG: zinc transporter ZupT [Candidatus Heimdallarchaeota archaeon]